MTVKEKIEGGKTYLGIEFGSTRIKAVLIDDTYVPVAGGSHGWENRLENGIWTYSLEDIMNGLKTAYADLKADVQEKYGVTLKKFGAMGISGMMHGYIALDKDFKPLVPFRTWRNTITAQAAEELTSLFGFNIPQRWSIAHLYQAILNNEEHIPQVEHITTLAGYVHYLLTGDNSVGIGEASGIFPINNGDYDKEMAEKFDKLMVKKGLNIRISTVLPKVRTAGEKASCLSVSGKTLLDGDVEEGIPFCPPEGDAGTGMVATNAVLPRTGNVSAGTSIFSMLVLEENLKGVYPEIDVVTTPDGAPVAMVHCNNCCSELDAWVKLFSEFSALSGNPMDIGDVYSLLYKNAMTGEADGGGVTAYNFLSGEPVAGIESGKPMYFRTPGVGFNLANFFRAQIMSAFATLKIGNDILFEKEKVGADLIMGHGGLFKVKGVAQQILADALNAKVSVMKTAGEGGAWGMALLAAYMIENEGLKLPQWLEERVFGGMEKTTLCPEKSGTEGFERFIERYKNGLKAQAAVGDV